MSLIVYLPLNGDLTNKGDNNAITVTNNGMTVNNNGRVDKCYTFTSSQNILIGNLPYSSLTTCSISFWVRVTQKGSTGWLAFTSIKSGATTQNGYLMATTNGIEAFYHSNAGSNQIIYCDGVQSTTPVNDTNWHHYCITNVNLSTWHSFYINNYPSNPWKWAGEIDEFRIYDTNLTPHEVENLYLYNPHKSMFTFDTALDYYNYITNDIDCPYYILNKHNILMYGEYHNQSNPSKVYFKNPNIKFIQYILVKGNTIDGKLICIDTEVIPNDINWKFECTFLIENWGTNSESYGPIFAAYNSNSNKKWRIIKYSTTNARITISTYSYQVNSSANYIPANTKFKVTLTNNLFTKYTYSSNTTASLTLSSTYSSTNPVVATMKFGSRQSMQTRFYMFNCWHNNELVRAMRPFKDSEGKYGFIDLINGKLYYFIYLNGWAGLIDEDTATYLEGSE